MRIVLRVLAVSAIAASAVALAGCGATDPYIYDPLEFDRTVPGYGTEPADIAEVSICYMGMVTSFDEVVGLAEARCRQFGKEAVFRDNGYWHCPASTPKTARFECVGPGDAQPGTPAADAPVQPVPPAGS